MVHVGLDIKNLSHCKICHLIPHSFLAHPQYQSKVKHIDSTLQCMSEPTGRIGCGTYENLCIGSTHQKKIRDVLQGLAELPYITRIDQSFLE